MTFHTYLCWIFIYTLPLNSDNILIFWTPFILVVEWYLLFHINYMFNMIGGLILVSHAPKW
ncbi:hypothetical protein Hanom_Chr00s011400g01747431 [Helianthus anomalus]